MIRSKLCCRAKLKAMSKKGNESLQTGKSDIRQMEEPEYKVRSPKSRGD